MNRGPISTPFLPQEVHPKQLTFFNAFSVDGAWSPDGASVAFASTEGGKARVWVVNADGSSPRAISTGNMSEAFDITWAPGARILYQQAGNRNFYSVDPHTRHERLLIKDSSVGWNMWAEYSPDGRKIAVSWNRRPSRGVWLIDTEDSHETLVYPSKFGGFPIGWSLDGRHIIVVDGKRAAYRGITASFGRDDDRGEDFARAPERRGAGDAAVAALRRGR